MAVRAFSALLLARHDEYVLGGRGVRVYPGYTRVYRGIHHQGPSEVLPGVSGGFHKRDVEKRRGPFSQLFSVYPCFNGLFDRTDFTG